MHHYILQLEISVEGKVVETRTVGLDRSITSEEYLFQLQHSNTYRVQVAGVDDRDRRGPWSPWSPSYQPADSNLAEHLDD